MDGPGLVSIFGRMAAALDAHRGRLCELDGAIGDGDHGITMSLGFAAILKALAALEAPEPGTVFATAAKAFLAAVGASAGPLYATAFLRAGAAVAGKPALDGESLARIVIAMAEGIAHRGKAEPGDKTMLDAWAPAANAARAALAEGATGAELLARAAQAAAEGAEATKAMQARKGRAARLGERSLGHADPGAASAALLLAAFAEGAAGSS
jgi:dihydroxyacetone kinase-like protein